VVHSVKSRAEVHQNEKWYLAVVRCVDKVVVDRKHNCFCGMERPVSRLMDRQQVVSVTMGSESPTLDEFRFVGQVRYGSVRAGFVRVQIGFLNNGRTRASLSCAGNMPDFKDRFHNVTDDWCNVTRETLLQPSRVWIQFTWLCWRVVHQSDYLVDDRQIGWCSGRANVIHLALKELGKVISSDNHCFSQRHWEFQQPISHASGYLQRVSLLPFFKHDG